MNCSPTILTVYEPDNVGTVIVAVFDTLESQVDVATTFPLASFTVIVTSPGM